MFSQKHAEVTATIIFIAHKRTVAEMKPLAIRGGAVLLNGLRFGFPRARLALHIDYSFRKLDRMRYAG